MLLAETATRIEMPDRQGSKLGPFFSWCRVVAFLIASALLLATSACSGAPGAHYDPPSLRESASRGAADIVNNLSAPALAAVIRASRDRALRDGTKPMPPQLRAAMSAYFDDGLLAEVRWTTSGARPGVDTLLAGTLEYEGAVTLGHVIVFFNEAAAADASLWAHELQHVRQYREAGIDGFARAYVKDWRRMEQEAATEGGRLFSRLFSRLVQRREGNPQQM